MTSHPPFARILDRAIRSRGLSMKELRAKSGVGLATLYAARRGTKLPSHPTVTRLADALEWEPLTQASLRLRQRTCVFCGADFISMSDATRTARYCAQRCRVAAGLRKERQWRAGEALIARFRLAEARAAVGAFCRGCEPAGICRTPDCALRKVSPLPLTRRKAA